MTIGLSIFLIALGAILRYAVSDAIEGISLPTIGLILMIAGVVGLVITLIMFMSDRGRGGGEVVERRRTTTRDPYV